MPHGFCISIARTWQPLLPHFEQRNRFFEVRELCIPSADVRQQIGTSATFMSAPDTLDYEKVLAELIGKALYLEIFRQSLTSILRLPFAAPGIRQPTV